MSGQGADPQAATAFEALGGEAAVRSLVDRFYDLMDLEPGYRALRAMHSTRRAGARAQQHGGRGGGLGGPQPYVARFGHPMLRARHLPFSIGIAERDQWLACMRQAMTEQEVEPAMAQRLADAFFKTADWMRNRGV